MWARGDMRANQASGTRRASSCRLPWCMTRARCARGEGARQSQKPRRASARVWACWEKMQIGSGQRSGQYCTQTARDGTAQYVCALASWRTYCSSCILAWGALITELSTTVRLIAHGLQPLQYCTHLKLHRTRFRVQLQTIPYCNASRAAYGVHSSNRGAEGRVIVSL